MCSSLKEFEVHARGVVSLVEAWKKEHAAVRAVWGGSKDLIAECQRLAGAAHELRDYYGEHDQFPTSTATYSYFVEILVESVRCGRDLDDLVGMFEAKGSAIERAEELARGMDRLQEIIDEDHFATNASFEGGALDDWN